MSDDPRSWVPPDQQPIFRVVGRHGAIPAGIPSRQTRDAMDSHLHYRTCAPRGVFLYRDHAQMTDHRERWRIETALARQQLKDNPMTDTEPTRPARWEDLKQVIAWLDEARVEYALVGGYALAAHGLTRMTEDIDIVVNPERANSMRWILALSRMPEGATKELQADPDVFAADKTYAVRINDQYTVDVMPQVGGHSWQELSAHIETIDLDNIPLRVLSLEGLLLTKQGVRPKDIMDAQAIRALIQARQSQVHGR